MLDKNGLLFPGGDSQDGRLAGFVVILTLQHACFIGQAILVYLATTLTNPDGILSFGLG
jgi:hypothetical protein